MQTKAAKDAVVASSLQNCSGKGCQLSTKMWIKISCKMSFAIKYSNVMVIHFLLVQDTDVAHNNTDITSEFFSALNITMHITFSC